MRAAIGHEQEGMGGPKSEDARSEFENEASYKIEVFENLIDMIESLYRTNPAKAD